MNVLKIVPTTAKSRIVPKWSKNGLLGMKKPASNIMGGNMQKKNTVGERGERTSKSATKRTEPMTMPAKISQQESGINCSTRGKLLRTVNNKCFLIF